MKKLFWSLLFILFSFRLVYAQNNSHIIEKGETFLGIALKYGLTQEQLQKVNPEINPEILIPGEALIIPPSDEKSFRDFLDNMFEKSIRISEPDCLSYANENTFCIITVHNIGNKSVNNVSIQENITDSVGKNRMVISSMPVNQINPEESIPILLNFENTLTQPLVVDEHVLSMENLPDSESHFRILSKEYDYITKNDPDKKGVSINIHFQNEISSIYNGRSISIYAAAYNSDLTVIGVRSWYGIFEQDIEMHVYSLTDQISTVKLWIEAF